VSKKAEFRSRTASTKVTEAEFAELESFASQDSQNLSEVDSPVAAERSSASAHSSNDLHLFTDPGGIQLLLMNALGPMLRGERMTAEQLDALLRQVPSTKPRKAQELLAKRQTAEQGSV